MDDASPSPPGLKPNLNHEVDLPSDETVYIATRRGRLLDLAIVLIVVTLIILVEAGYLPQRQLGFVCDDPKLSYPYAGDSIPTTALLIISYSFPLLYIGVMEYVCGVRGRNLGASLLKWYREFLIGINIALVLCQLSKVLTGELRPHFFHTCAPDVAKTCLPGQYVSDYVCTSKFPHRLIKDTFRSFPSGHTAVSTYAAAFTSYYVHYRYNLRTWGAWIKPMLISFTLLWAPFTSFSRLTDNRHHWWDVLAGLCIGLFASVYTVNVLCEKFNRNETRRRNDIPLTAPLLINNNECS